MTSKSRSDAATSLGATKGNFKRNTLYNLSGSLLSMGVSLITVPLFLHKIGTERYGVLAIIWLFLGYFGVFDLGLSRATANQIAKRRDPNERIEIFWTATLLNAGIGMVGGLILYFIGDLVFQDVFKMPSSARAGVVAMMPWLAISVPLATVSGVFTGSLEACERFLLVNSLQVAGTVMLQVVPLTVAFLHGPQLKWLIAAAILTRIVTMFPLLVSVSHTLSVGRPRMPRGRWAKELFGYGAWITISNIIDPMFASLDKFMIGGIAGLSSVTYYSVPERLARQASLVPSALARTLFPRLSAEHELDARATAVRSLAALIAVLTPLTVLTVLIMRPFLALWIDRKFATFAGSAGLVISASMWINGLAWVPASFLQARGRPDLTAKFHLIEIVPHIALLWLGLHMFGLIGGAWALLFRNTLDATLLFWKSELRIHELAVFWEGIAWVVLALAIGSLGTFLRSGFYLFAVLALLGSTGWSVRTSPELAALLHKRLGRQTA
jgi:O-antigen/teichoic acid export membrane protein